MQRLTILGSTGSIGRQTLDVVRAAPERFRIHALAAGRNAALLEEQIREFKPSLAVLLRMEAARELRGRVQDLSVRVEAGMAGMLRAVQEPGVDKVVTAVSGRIGLEPTLAALQAGKCIALANKETLVAAGDLVMRTARTTGCAILPVDSEHSAIFQCLEDDGQALAKILLTASGGPFRTCPLEHMPDITPAEALAHPNWSMGDKITIDSATMMNKGLEVIEAHHLFGVTYDQIEVLIHPQSVIHSMVEYRDGSVLAQLGRADMRLPIQYALDYPVRYASPWERLNLRNQELSFFAPDLQRFPALGLAYRVGRRGGTLPAVMNAANEVAVRAFLREQISFARIIAVAEEICALHDVIDDPDLPEILAADAWARRLAAETVERSAGIKGDRS
ncbi:MAG: 1-deoxy-D-xylulose-5-phosphate reductoisomerase [Peptococcaceae bacterium]|nr:1-deoxy-D-xylulose-5-phosphate reductoisomerase [Peptococcaceae bacterium]